MAEGPNRSPRFSLFLATHFHRPAGEHPKGISWQCSRGLAFIGTRFGFSGQELVFARRYSLTTAAQARVQGTGHVPFPTQQRPAGTTSPVRWHAFFLIELPFDTVGVVDQAVEDPVGLRRVDDLRVATRHRLVRGENRGSGLIPVFADFPEVTTLPFV
jgi:hypothetical protein